MANLEDAPRCRRVSYGQLESLCEFLNSHRDIALGYNKSAQARDYSRRMWQRVAQILNSMGDGAIKDWKAWSKYWVDYKAKLKRKVSNIRIARGRTGGGPSSAPPLTDVECRYLQIMGEDFGAGLPGVRMDPFENVPMDQATPSTSLDTPVLLVVAPDEEPLQSVLDSISILHPQSQPHDAELVSPARRADDDGAGNGDDSFRAVEASADGSAGDAGAGNSIAAEGRDGPSITGRIPAVRRRRRRVVTAEAARQILIDIAERRAETEISSNHLLCRLVDAVEGIHATLRQITRAEYRVWCANCGSPMSTGRYDDIKNKHNCLIYLDTSKMF